MRTSPSRNFFANTDQLWAHKQIFHNNTDRVKVCFNNRAIEQIPRKASFIIEIVMVALHFVRIIWLAEKIIVGRIQSINESDKHKNKEEYFIHF